MSILSTRARQALFILDACRDNPFLDAMVVEGLTSEPVPIEAGFFFQRSPIDTFVAFSTSPGELALDGPEGENSPFTASFVANALANPGAEINALMARTRRDVHGATNGRQLPWESSSLTDAFPLQTGAPPGPALAKPAAPTNVTPPTHSPSHTSTGLTIEARFERDIALGADLARRLAQRDSGLVFEPRGGTLSRVENGRVRTLSAGDTIPPDTLGTLVFHPDTPRFPP